jgi:shikimate dehydrogenase
MSTKKIFGLVGKNIAYSFSRNYFSEKFTKLNLNNCSYRNFDLDKIEDFSAIFSEKSACIFGLNVTIPYKEKVGVFLDEIDQDATNIGAVNTIKILPSGIKKGYNTDVYGFSKSIEPLLKEHHKKALILGTGGASKAVAYAFDKLGIQYKFVSRVPKNDTQISYESIDASVLNTHTLLVNCSPLGTSPEVHLCPDIPYDFLTNKHLLYDLIYNPSETKFLRKGKEKGAVVKNGLQMLELQAEKSWEIWNS